MRKNKNYKKGKNCKIFQGLSPICFFVIKLSLWYSERATWLESRLYEKVPLKPIRHASEEISQEEICIHSSGLFQLRQFCEVYQDLSAQGEWVRRVLELGVMWEYWR